MAARRASVGSAYHNHRGDWNDKGPSLAGGGGGGHKRPRSPEPVEMELDDGSPSPPPVNRDQESQKLDPRGTACCVLYLLLLVLCCVVFLLLLLVLMLDFVTAAVAIVFILERFSLPSTNVQHITIPS